MNLHELRPAEGSTSARKRVGRGSGSGIGKTAVTVTRVEGSQRKQEERL